MRTFRLRVRLRGRVGGRACACAGARARVVWVPSGGEPARVVVAGAPEVPGKTMMEKRNYMMVHGILWLTRFGALTRSRVLHARKLPHHGLAIQDSLNAHNRSFG